MSTTVPAMTRNYSAITVGPLKELMQYDFNGMPGKCFVGDLAGLTGAEISINRMPAGIAMPFTHKHREHEEIYLIVGGSGTFWIDGETFDVSEGSVVRVAPEGERAWKASDLEDLYFVCVQAPAGGLRQRTTSDGYHGDSPAPWKRNGE